MSISCFNIDGRTAADQAQGVVCRLREECLRVGTAQHAKVLRISAGIVEFKLNESAQGLTRRADHAMDENKRATQDCDDDTPEQVGGPGRGIATDI